MLSAARGLAWLDSLLLDLELAARLLARYPWLTIVGGAAMTFGIVAGVGGFEIRTQLLDPSLPLDEGSRIVAVRNWDASRNRTASTTAADFATWRDTLTLVEDVSAFGMFRRNLITDAGRSEPVAVAAMTASAFTVARVRPLLGRALVKADEVPGAPPVLVIGHSIWTQWFNRDADVVGRIVRLGREQSTVVGVMPEGFAFPAAHSVWVPLRDDGPEFLVFGRLAQGASRSGAQAELSAIGARTASDSPETHAQLRAQLVPFTWLILDPENLRVGLALGNVFLVMLLVLVSANVALLMFARAATRESEIAVRSALGAGRARIVVQLFVEALVLAGLAVSVGLATARFGLRTLLAAMEADSGRDLPFWMSDSLTPTTVLYAGALTVVSAVIIGVLPALKITGDGQQTRLRELSAGAGGFRFGGVWTVVIAMQVAATLTFPAAAFFFHRWVVAGQTRDIGVAADRYLSALLELDREAAPSLRNTYAELERHLAAEPEVAGVTFAEPLPGTGHPQWRIETDGQLPPGASAPGYRVSSASVALNFFDVFSAPALVGRHFRAADAGSAAGVVVVNQALVNQVFGGRNPVGRRLRRATQTPGTQTPGPWLEVVGVVRDLGMLGNDAGAGLYHPVSADAAPALRVAIHVRGRADAFAARLRSVARDAEPGLQIQELMPLDQAGATGWTGSLYMSRILTVLSAVALLLSLTAIYAVTAFTVSKRAREIGIRVALGADRRRVIGPILRRPLAQVGMGVSAGAVLVALASAGLFERTPSVREAAMIGAYAMLMMAICLLACVVPVRRALRVEPAEILRGER
jgi:predicted permease